MQQHSHALIPSVLERLVGVESSLTSMLLGTAVALFTRYLPISTGGRLALTAAVALAMWALHTKYKGIMLASIARYCMRNAEHKHPAHMVTRGGRLATYAFVRYRSKQARHEVIAQLAAIPFYMVVGALLASFDVTLLAAIPALVAAPLIMIYTIDGFRLFCVGEADCQYIHGSIDANAFVRGLNA